jgi:S-adenosylmethionine hydrolase
MKILTFLTDFGHGNNYVAQMKGMALSLTDARIVDITHDITPHDISEGAYVLLKSVLWFPAGTVHVAVVDPGVGTERRGLVITTRTQVLVGPDNGLLIPAARNLGLFTVYEITNKALLSNPVSSTFHGRDVFTPVAAHILNGVNFEEIGPAVNDFVDLDLCKIEVSGRTITGKIIFVDDFGNLVTNIEGGILAREVSRGGRITVILGERQYDVPFIRSYGYASKGKLVAMIGSGNLLEMAINMGDTAKKTGARRGDEIKILFQSELGDRVK